jgi:superfamily I DNA/RNA helicase
LDQCGLRRWHRDLDGGVTVLRPDDDHDLVCGSQAGHLLVVAPPGTGKTCLSVRLAGTLAPTLDASERVLLVTFSNQARVQLEHEAARQLTAAIRQRIEVTNYHRFFWRAVRAYRRALGLPLDVQIGSRRGRLSALREADQQAIARLQSQEGLLDALAEHQFEYFQDERTPVGETLDRLLAVIEQEQRAGRLVFDDLGALFWRLVEAFPAVDAAYRARYPVVIADEHQDASELQDAVVRRLGRRRLVVLADPMQLIYGFRGSKPERLERHVQECDDRFELRTPHRWHQNEETGRWLLAVRRRLQGEIDQTPAPGSLQILETRAAHGLNAMKPRVKAAAAQAFRDGAATVAVLDAWNNEVAELRAYLSREGLYPRQLGGGDDFEDAREDIEQLPLFDDPESVARHAVERVKKLVPTLSSAVVEQVKRRLSADGVDLSGNCGVEAAALLRAFEPLYQHGGAHYVASVVAALDACSARGHHLPRIEAVRALRTTAEGFTVDGTDLDGILAHYAESVVTASQAAPRVGRGLFVMTAHQAKGKEFDVVIIVNASARHFPDTDEGGACSTSRSRAPRRHGSWSRPTRPDRRSCPTCPARGRQALVRGPILGQALFPG